MRFRSILVDARRRKQCDITESNLLLLWEQQNSRCAYCGTEMTYERGGRKVTSVSVDRINSSGHYTMDNVVLTCWACNSGKGTMTPEEYFQHCKKVAQQHPDS
jgi:CRISPR/Cas system Type II protein with McrA/HNH and RuvC-like nuclease domain